MVEAERFAWWGVEDPAAEAARIGLPHDERRQLLVAIPDDEARTVETHEVPAVFVGADTAVPALATWSHPAEDVSQSLRTWSRIATALADGNDVDDLIHALPTAGHAPAALDGSTIWSARATVEAARSAVSRPCSATAPVHATLRPYQRAGVAWLRSAVEHGGGILADEMGLGKTLQAIAVLAHRTRGPHLVVCPTSLIGNWRSELARFAPGVPVIIHTGAQRGQGLLSAGPGCVVLTSYGTLRGDAVELAGLNWDTVILDEAQQIKNPDAKVSRAARGLHAQLRVAMTGTPVENRLDELWALMTFTNPGLLGGRARFRRRFAVAIEQRHSAAAARRLHEIVGPHILRRSKADVAPELPTTIDSTVVCRMTDEQERLYRASLDEAFGSGLGSGVQRRGRILALLTRLKQVCNHPEHIEPVGTDLAARSGKLDRVTETLTEIVDSGQRALVFTQYRRTGELLARHLGNEVTGETVPFLHGGLPTRTREELLNRFQEATDGPPILLLSLRAAGFGLNLTRATHVVHYDRWWNPAVEAQASARAHRIGQTHTVTVHTLVTERTLEETIARLHEGKRDLAGIATGESPATDGDLARLSDEELRAVLDGVGGTRS